MISPEHWFKNVDGTAKYPNAPRIFVDLDGVMADFDQGYLDRFGHKPEDAEDDDAMWANVRSVDRFFANLPQCHAAIFAWNLIQPLSPIILTACPEHDYQHIADQKHEWVRKNIPGNPLVIPIVRGKNKARLVQAPGDILIDDFEKNCLPWQAAGGIPIFHTQWNRTIPTLHSLLKLREMDHADQRQSD